MEMQWIRENMETEQVISAKPTQVSVEAEVALPGGLREEAQVYFADASAAVNGGEMTGSRVTADGRVTFHVLYAQGDLSRVEALEASADFSQALPLREENPQTAALRMQPRAEVQHVSAKAFNGRLLLRAILSLTAETALPRTVSFIQDVSDAPQAQKIMQTLTVQRTVGEGENQTLLREEFPLNEALQIKNTLYATAQAQVEDILGGADGRATVTGTVTVEACHTSALPGRPLLATRHTMPFEQAVNLSGALGDALTAQSAVRDVAVLSQDGEDGGKIMRAEVQLFTQVSSVADGEMTVLRDVFTTEGEEVDIRRQQVRYRSGTVHETAAESGKTVLQLPEGSPRVKTALLGFVRPVIAQVQEQRGRLAVEGVLDATVIYLTDDSDVPVSVRREEPFRTVFSVDALPEDRLSLSASQVEANAVTGDRVELKYILRLAVEGARKDAAEVITDAAMTEEKETPRGLMLYYVQPGEELWDIARRYRVPQEELRRMNPGLGETVAAGTPVVVMKR